MNSEPKESPVCKFCFSDEEESGEPLILPCRCSGGVHRSCLDGWRSAPGPRNSLRFDRCTECDNPYVLIELPNVDLSIKRSEATHNTITTWIFIWVVLIGIILCYCIFVTVMRFATGRPHTGLGKLIADVVFITCRLIATAALFFGTLMTGRIPIAILAPSDLVFKILTGAGYLMVTGSMIYLMVETRRQEYSKAMAGILATTRAVKDFRSCPHELPERGREPRGEVLIDDELQPASLGPNGFRELEFWNLYGLLP